MKYHFYLHNVELMFVTSEGQASGARVSVVVQSEDQNVTVKELAKAQQMAQAGFCSKHGMKIDQDVTFIDAINVSFCYCGHMTVEEFSHEAEGPTVVANDDLETAEPAGQA